MTITVTSVRTACINAWGTNPRMVLKHINPKDVEALKAIQAKAERMRDGDVADAERLQAELDKFLKGRDLSLEANAVEFAANVKSMQQAAA